MNKLKNKTDSNNYIIYSGYYDNIDVNKYGGLSANDYFKYWYDSTIQSYDENNTPKIVLVGPHKVDKSLYPNIIDQFEYPNLGHVGDYIHGKRTGKWCGWTAGMVYGMAHAYANNKDFIYREQDCLCFGNCVDVLYDQIKHHDIIFGNCRIMGTAVSYS
jgi:hypothetical protein